jgi:hypothetical protein
VPNGDGNGYGRAEWTEERTRHLAPERACLVAVCLSAIRWPLVPPVSATICPHSLSLVGGESGLPAFAHVQHTSALKASITWSSSARSARARVGSPGLNVSAETRTPYTMASFAAPRSRNPHRSNNSKQRRLHLPPLSIPVCTNLHHTTHIPFVLLPFRQLSGALERDQRPSSAPRSAGATRHEFARHALLTSPAHSSHKRDRKGSMLPSYSSDRNRARLGERMERREENRSRLHLLLRETVTSRVASSPSAPAACEHIIRCPWPATRAPEGSPCPKLRGAINEFTNVGGRLWEKPVKKLFNR